MFADIAIFNSTLDFLTYQIPDRLAGSINRGDLVKIELKKKIRFGIVLRLVETTRIGYAKDIRELCAHCFIPDDLMQLLSWASQYYLADWGGILNLAIPKNVFNFKAEDKTIRICKDSELESWQDAEINSLTNCKFERPEAARIISSLNRGQYQTFLLFNPDNESRVRIYCEMIKANLCLHKSAIMLVPEIALTLEFVNAYRKCFGDALFCLHSDLKIKERKAVWRQIKERNCSVVMGTRSAIFAPVNNLGLVIVDAEHDISYKEIERHFHYHARDLAVVRGKLSKAVTVLASATPCCESFYNAKVGKYKLITLPPRVRKDKNRLVLIDVRKSRSQVITSKLAYEMKSAQRRGRPIILYLNRLGYARLIQCRDCGYSPLCPQCGISLVLHRDRKLFVCRICKYQMSAFDYCPQCRGNDFAYQGIGIQQVVQEVKKIRFDSEIIRFDANNRTNPVFEPRELKSKQILVTTKLGLKNIGFTGLGLFGIISSDIGLFISDFRAGEKTFQELTQIINQCQSQTDTMLIIQTCHPDNYAIGLAVQRNYDKFYTREIDQRKKLNYPPFSRLALISISSKDCTRAEKATGIVEQRLSEMAGLTVLGPSQISSKKKQNKYTYQFLIKTLANLTLSRILSRADFIFDKVDVDINIDPV